MSNMTEENHGGPTTSRLQCEAKARDEQQQSLICARVGHAVQTETRDLHFPAHARNYHGDAPVVLAKIEKQNHAAIHLGITVQKFMLAQMRNQGVFHLDLFA